MTAVPVAERMTAEQYLELPPSQDARRLELVDGELIVHFPTWLHSSAATDIQYGLEAWLRATPGRGRTGQPLEVLMDEHNVYVPDVVWYREERVPARDDPRPYPVPDIAVEVRSPSTWRYDIGAKKAGYERFGLPELWLVDTAADVLLVFRRAAPTVSTFDIALELTRDDTLTSPLLPGFALALAELFPPPE